MDRIQAAIIPLIGYPDFVDFMETIRQMKDEAVEFSVSFEGVATERQSLVSKGEVRTYLNILSIYDGQREQMEQVAEEAAQTPQQ